MEEIELYGVIGKNLKAIRGAKGVSQEKLAALCLVDQATISNIELGRRGPSIEVLEILSKALQVPAALFLAYPPIS
jgi:transcriptional regulator with XRE-family HTH domain